MKTKLFIALVLLSLPVILGVLFTSQVMAQSDTSVVIQPSKVEVTASPGQKIARTFSIINRSNYYVNLKLVVKDYKQVSDNGQLNFYDAPGENASTWLIPQFLQIGLKPLETKDIGLVINVPKDFSGGGHYGAILFQSTNNSTNINTSNFGELVLLTVTGTSIKTTAVGKSVNFWTAAIQQGNYADFSFKMQNTGNTQFEAQGKLVLKDWFGRDVGNFNVGQLTVYPGTTRVFQWRWNNVPMMGIFNASIMLADPSSSQNLKTVDGTWFVIFPWEVILIGLLICLAVLAAVSYRQNIVKLFKSDKKNRKHIAKARVADGENSLASASVRDVLSK